MLMLREWVTPLPIGSFVISAVIGVVIFFISESAWQDLHMSSSAGF